MCRKNASVSSIELSEAIDRAMPILPVFDGEGKIFAVMSCESWLDSAGNLGFNDAESNLKELSDSNQRLSGLEYGSEDDSQYHCAAILVASLVAECSDCQAAPTDQKCSSADRRDRSQDFDFR